MNKKLKIIILLLFFTNGIYAQEELNNTSFEAFWELPIIPLKISYGTDGLSLSLSSKVQTPLGVFGVSGNYIRKFSNNNSPRIVEKIIYKDRIKVVERIVYAKEKDFVLIIKKGFKEYIFVLEKLEAISFETIGTTKIEANYKKLYIDITNANINNIVFRGKKNYESYINELDNEVSLSDLYGLWKIAGTKYWDNDKQKWIINKKDDDDLLLEHQYIKITPNYLSVSDDLKTYNTVSLNDELVFRYKNGYSSEKEELFMSVNLLSKNVLEYETDGEFGSRLIYQKIKDYD